MLININEIKINNRFRKDYGDIAALAKNIEEIGLLHPIVINSNNELVCGGRRIEAMRYLLRTEIEARIIDIESVILGEYAENEVRKDFTQSERVAIGKAIEESLAGRVGRPSKEEITQNFAELKGKESSEIAAQKAGFSNKETYRQAKNVVDNGVPELVQKMDDGEMSIYAASNIAGLPRERQAEIVARGEEEIKRAYKEITAKKQEEKQLKLAQKKEEILKATSRDISGNKPTVFEKDCIDFLNQVADESVDLLITDPPYSTDVDDIELFAANWLPVALNKIKSDGRAYICIGAYPKEIKAYLDVLHQQDKFIVDCPLIWTYRNTLGVTPKFKYNLNYQVVLHLYTEESDPLDTSITNEMFSVQDINAPDGRLGDRFHAWQKPDELAFRLIRHSTKDGDLVVDPFACTGTFLIAASKLNRSGSGCDISKDNLKIAESRGCHVIYA